MYSPPRHGHCLLALLLQNRIEQHTGGLKFNSCLLNYYRDGNDSLSYHSDNEKEYGSEPSIASVSLGIAREFVLRKNTDHSVKYSFALGPGDLLVMQGTVQRDWMHAVPKRKGKEGGRINLTFRQVVM